MPDKRITRILFDNMEYKVREANSSLPCYKCDMRENCSRINRERESEYNIGALCCHIIGINKSLAFHKRKTE